MKKITNPIIFLANLWSPSVGLRRKMNRDNSREKTIKRIAAWDLGGNPSQIETEGSIKLKMNLNIYLI